MTKKQQALWKQYKRATNERLEQCYANPSMAKRKAYEEIRELCYTVDGWGIRIPSYNTMMFTMAFLYRHPSNDKLFLHYETNKNVWDFEVPADQL